MSKEYTNRIGRTTLSPRVMKCKFLENARIRMLTCGEEKPSQLIDNLISTLTPLENLPTVAFHVSVTKVVRGISSPPHILV